MTEQKLTCCFTGHRPTKLPWGDDENDPRCRETRRLIREAVAAAYVAGYRRFLCGMAMGCDFYFAEEVLALRNRFGEAVLEAVLPCPEQAERWSAAAQRRWRDILAQCDYETVVQGQYSPGCMQRRNRYMVDHSDLVIAVYNGESGGTRQTLEHAIRRGVPYQIIWPEEGRHE